MTTNRMSPRTSATADVNDDTEEGSFDLSSLRRYAHAPLRRPLLVAVPWAAVILLSVVSLFFLPKRYKSSTLILIESEKLPESFVPRVATGDRAQRLDAIRPEILSRTRLERIIADTEPYPQAGSMRQSVDQLRRRVFVNASGSDGFTIEFVHGDPYKAQEVTNRLATLFIEETIKAREGQVEDAVDFLVTQVEDARRELEAKEEALRRFKEQRMGHLPEQLQTNLATMGMLQQELRTVEEGLIFARERQAALARAGGRAQSAGRASLARDDLADLKRQLTLLKGRYTDEHPDVQALAARIGRLETSATGVAPAGNPETVDPTSPVVREQLETADAELVRLERKREDLERRIAGLRARVEQTPRTEQELVTLTRDYEKLSENYAALLAKQLDAQMARRLERRWKGDQFRILDPADLPEKPYFPNPLIILGLGSLAGLFVGVGAAVAAEFFDPTVKGVSDLSGFGDASVLACIPHLPGPDEPRPSWATSYGDSRGEAGR